MSTGQHADLRADTHTGHRDGERVSQPSIPVHVHGSNNGATLGATKVARPGAMGLDGSIGIGAAKHKGAFLSAAKRGIDIVLALLALILTAPLMAVLAVVIRFDSKGPVLFRQTRVGRDGRNFELVKLRTMYRGQGVHATRVGRILRPMGLDELPQFWNVLVGHMSVVGPRPERPHLVAEYESKLRGYAGRHAVRPGITGWAQIHGLRGGAGSIAERLSFDLDYVRIWNPVKDLQILVLTLTAVWRDTRRELRL